MATYTYPLSLPSTNFKTSTFQLQRKSAISQSPFTGKQQVHLHSNFALWKANLTLTPMKRTDARNWQAFFVKLRGRSGTFLLGDPDATTPLGAGAGTITLASTATAGDTTISITGFSNSNGVVVLKAGDYIQVGDTLHIVVADATKSGTNVSVDIEPIIKNTTSASGSVVITGAKGKFRLDDEIVSWDADHVSNYGFTFSCTEAV
jgi:hypothetical protein